MKDGWNVSRFYEDNRLWRHISEKLGKERLSPVDASLAKD